MAQYTLYSYFRSSASQRVRVALNLKGVSVETKYIHLVKDGGQQNSEDFKTVNPQGQVPVLEFGGERLSQSMAIVEYLDQAHPTPSLFPMSPIERAHVIEFCEVLNSGIQPLQNLVVLKTLETKFHGTQQDKEEWARLWITRGFDALEKRMQKTAGQFSFGGQVTAADVFLVPQVFTAKRFNLDMTKYPLISRVSKNCGDIEAFKKAEPQNQPDFAP